MSRKQCIRALSLSVLGIVIVFKSYVIVIGQTAKPVLVALNKADSTLAIIDPAEMKILGKVPTGDSPHEVVLSSDGKTAFVANYGAQTPGSSLSVVDTEARKELRRVDLIDMCECPAQVADRVLLVDRLDLIQKRVDRVSQFRVHVKRQSCFGNLHRHTPPLHELIRRRIRIGRKHPIVQRRVHALPKHHIVDVAVTLEQLHLRDLLQRPFDLLG